MEAEKQGDSLLVTKAEACRLLCICARTLDSLLASGQLPSMKLGKRRLIRRHQLEQFIKRDVPTISKRNRKQ